MNKTASASERNQAVVQGQENLVGVKEVQITRKFKKNSENEYVVSESVRTEMLYDTASEAKSAYNNIQDAKEEAEFTKSDTDDTKDSEESSDKEASFSVGMVINAKYTVKAVDGISQKLLLSDGANTSWVPQNMALIVQKHPNFALNLPTGEIVPGDTGTCPPTTDKATMPLDMASPQTQTAIDRYVGPSGYSLITEPTPEVAFALGAHAEVESLLQPGFTVSDFENELKLGVNREMEHVDDPAKATEIALDHLAEDKQYYTKLNKVLPESGVEEKPKRELSIHDLKDAAHNYDYETACREFFKGNK